MNNVYPESIVMMEDHDKAYHAWRERGITGAVLVHVDAHIDFGFIPDTDFDEIDIGDDDFLAGARGKRFINPFIMTRRKMTHIGNYIYPAMRDGIVDKFYWVVPDASISCRKGIKNILRYLTKGLGVKKYSIEILRDKSYRIRYNLLGKEACISGLSGLEYIDRPVLLDIDVDFMITKFIWNDLEPGRMPWIFSEELIKRLWRSIDSIDMLTISYSVEGGYTPIRFKYLGDELRDIYSGNLSEKRWRVIEFKRLALLREISGRKDEARALYREILSLDDNDASAYFNLFLLMIKDGHDFNIKEASSCFKRAIELDSTYASIYNNYGILYLRRKKFSQAADEYRKILLADINNIAASNGMGHLFSAIGQYSKAIDHFNRAMYFDSANHDTRRGMGIVHFKNGSLDHAESLLRSLGDDLPEDHDIRWWLGRIAEKKGKPDLAIEHYKKAVMLGGEGPVVHLRLARLYFKRKLYRRVSEELGRFFRELKNIE